MINMNPSLRLVWLIVLAVLLAVPPPRAAAQFGPALGPEMVSENTAGEATRPLANYWDGVDGENNLRVNITGAPVLNDVGEMVDTAMPSYPNFVDMNGDGLKDLVVADTLGFLWIYLNSGEKGKPKFTTGVFVPTFIGFASTIHVCDWDGDGDQDVMIGTFRGDIAILENRGSRNDWRFTRSMGIPRYMDPTWFPDDPKEALPQVMMGKKPMIKGNYMATWVCDWNKDGKPDLLLGEGTYSANSVRLFVNSGSRNKPVFSDEKEFYLAFGEGFEHLVPAVVDYNGDGLDDLIVGTRTGQIRLHKGTKKAVESKDFIAAMHGTLAPAILECEGNLKIAGQEIFSPMSAPYPCDWNEDGLFDLLLGSPQGRIYIALNKGTKTAPQFPAAEPVKGADVEKDLLAPAGYGSCTDRNIHGNPLAAFCNSALLLTCEKEAEIKPGLLLKPVAGQFFIYFQYVKHYPGWIMNGLSYIGAVPGANTRFVTGGRFIAPSQSFNLRLDKKYQLSFSSVLVGKPAAWSFWSVETIKEATDESPGEAEYRSYSGAIAPSTTWQKRSFTFKSPNTVQTNLNYNFVFRLPEGECKFAVDNLSLRELEK